ncbi:MAG: sodium:calcium antiporter, partial [Acidobacteriota bacterium]
SLRAALQGNGDIAVGNVVGSNIANICLILALGALLRPMAAAAQVLKVEAPLALGASVLLVGMLLDGGLARWEGALLFAGIVVYTTAAVVLARKEPPAIREEFETGIPASRAGLGLLVPLVLGGLVLLVLGARLFLSGATFLAREAGISEAFIGLSLVAVGTSLPERVTTVLAAWKGEADIAVGNVVGSNLFNVLGILGLSALAAPIEIRGIAPLDLAALVLSGALLLPVLFTGRRVTRPEGVAFLALYAIYLAARAASG